MKLLRRKRIIFGKLRDCLVNPLTDRIVAKEKRHIWITPKISVIAPKETADFLEQNRDWLVNMLIQDARKYEQKNRR